MVGLPGRQARPGLLGVEPVHVSHVVAGPVQDRLELENVGPVRADVQLPVEGEVAGDRHGLPTVDGEQCVALGHHLAGLDPDAADPAVGRRVDGLQFIAAQFASDGDLIGEGSDGHRLGDGTVHTRIGRFDLPVPRPHGEEPGGYPSEEDQDGQDLLHEWDLRIGKEKAAAAMGPAVIGRRPGSAR